MTEIQMLSNLFHSMGNLKNFSSPQSNPARGPESTGSSLQGLHYVAMTRNNTALLRVNLQS